MEKPIIGFITQMIGMYSEKNTSYCGIGIKGKLTGEILTKQVSDKYIFKCEFINTNQDIENFIITHNPVLIIYNYHSITTPFLNDCYIRNKYSNIIHVIIHYDLLQHHIDNFNPNMFSNYNYVITDNNTLNVAPNNNNIFKVTRSIPFHANINKYVEREDKIPIIGFQGFGFLHKGIHRVANIVQEEFDEAIIRLQLPYSYYGDPNGQQARERVKEVNTIITKPGIKIEVSHEFLSDEKIIESLNKNTINCYFYDYLENAGIASSPDYAIASFRPISINNSRMFVNLHNLEPSIEIEKLSLKNIIANGIIPLIPLHDKYSHSNVLHDYEIVCDKLLKNKL